MMLKNVCLIACIIGIIVVVRSMEGEYVANFIPPETGGAAGSFTVSVNAQGYGSYNWNINLNSFQIPSAAASSGCTWAIIQSLGLKYHIHSYWDSVYSQGNLSSTQCGSATTGCQNHYDPFLACSSASQSASTLCTTLSRTSTAGYVYNCSASLYAIGHVALCEVGDLSGKFGSMKMESSSNKQFSGLITDDPLPPFPRYYEKSDVISLPWASVVFHCPVSGNPRILCAQLVPEALSAPTSSPTTSSSSSGNQYLDALIGVIVLCAILSIAVVVLAVSCVHSRQANIASSTSGKAMAQNENL